MHNGLIHLLEDNGITSSIKVPKATKTVVKDWTGGWYWQREGSLYTNQDITKWATKPLEGENIGLASDAYYSQRTGWIEGPLLSANALLMAQYSMSGVTYPHLLNNNLTFAANPKVFYKPNL